MTNIFCPLFIWNSRFQIIPYVRQWHIRAYHTHLRGLLLTFLMHKTIDNWFQTIDSKF